MITENERKNYFTETLMQEIRDRFCYIDEDPYNGKRIFFANAGGSLTLKSVAEIDREIISFPDYPSRHNDTSRHMNDICIKGRDDFMTMIGAKSGKIVTSLTASRVMFHITGAIIENTPGTNVVTTRLEHPCGFDSVQYYAGKTSKEVRIAEVDLNTGGISTKEIIKNIDKDTCLLSFISASNITGAILDAENIIKEARRINPDIYIITDAVQHLPHAAIDFDSLQVDGLAMAPYKYFCKRGLGFGYVSERASKLAHEKVLAEPVDEWELGSEDPSGYACLSAVMDYVCWLGMNYTKSDDRRVQFLEGMHRIELHERALLERTLNGTNEIPGLRKIDGVTTHFDNEDLTKRDFILAISFDGIKTRVAVNKYQENGILLFDRVATDPYSGRMLEPFGLSAVIRVSPMHYHLPEEMDTFLKVTAKIAGDI